MIDRNDADAELVARYVGDPEFRQAVTDHLMLRVYHALRDDPTDEA